MPAEAVAALRAAWKEGRAPFRDEVLRAGRRRSAAHRVAPPLLYRAIGDLLPEGFAEGAGVWGLCQIFAQRNPASLARAGFAGAPAEAGDALFDAMLASKSAVVFSVDEWEQSFERMRTPNQRVQLAIRELFGELDGLAAEPPRGRDAEFPVPSFGRRAPLVHGQHHHSQSRLAPEGPRGALRINPDDAKRVGVADGGRARITTRRGSAEVAVEISDRMMTGHLVSERPRSGFPGPGGAVTTGVAPNELTRSEDRDSFAGTPWHKSTPARVEALPAR